MNIKSIQKNYELLSMRERFSIFDAAWIRGDEREIEAVYAASPHKTYKVIDYYFFRQAVFALHQINIIERWNHQTMAEVFLEASTDREDNSSDSYSDGLKIAGYLYVIETDAWALVGEEFGFDVRGYRERLAREYCAIRHLEEWDSILRKVAFTVDQAKEALSKSEKVEAGFNIKTLESVAEMYRAILLEEEK